MEIFESFKDYSQRIDEAHKEFSNADFTIYTKEKGRMFINSIYTNEFNDLNLTFHRKGAPAVYEFDDKGNVFTEDYYINGEKHREDGPASIEYFDNGVVFLEEWYFKNKRHRDNGRPAVIEYDAKGNPTREEYWINGKQIKNKW